MFLPIYFPIAGVIAIYSTTVHLRPNPLHRQTHSPEDRAPFAAHGAVCSFVYDMGPQSRLSITIEAAAAATEAHKLLQGSHNVHAHNHGHAHIMACLRPPKHPLPTTNIPFVAPRAVFYLPTFLQSPPVISGSSKLAQQRSPHAHVHVDADARSREKVNGRRHGRGLATSVAREMK